MMAPAKKPIATGDTIKFPGLGVISYRMVLALSVLGLTPAGDAFFEKVGLKTQRGELEAVRQDLQQAKLQLAKVDDKLTGLIIKVESRQTAATP